MPRPLSATRIMSVFIFLSTAVVQAQEAPKADAATIGPWRVQVLSHEMLETFSDGKVTVRAEGAIRVAVVTLKLKQTRDFNDDEVKALKKTGFGEMALNLRNALNTKLIVSSTCFYLGYLEKPSDTPHLTLSECTLMKIENGRVASGSIAPKDSTVPTVFFANTVDDEIEIKLAFPAKKQTEEPLLFFSPTADGQGLSVISFHVDKAGMIQSVNYTTPKDLLTNVPKGELPSFGPTKTRVSKEPNAQKPKSPEVDGEKTAEGKLKFAKSLLKTNRTAARKRLEEIVKDFDGTEAAKEANKLLNNN